MPEVPTATLVKEHPSLHDWLEQPEQLRNLDADGIAEFKHAPERFDGYLSEDLGVEIHISTPPRAGHGDPEYFLLRCWSQAGNRAAEFSGSVGQAVNELVRVYGWDDHLCERQERGVDEAMLGEVRQIAESAKGWWNETRPGGYFMCPSLVRLFWFHNVDRILSDPMRPISGVEVLSGSADGELDAVGLVLGRLPLEVFDRQLPPGEVQGGTEIVDDIADQQAEIFRQLRHALHDDDDSVQISLVFANEGEGIHTFFQGLGYNPSNLVYAGLRMFKLGPSVTERFGHSGLALEGDRQETERPGRNGHDG